jgi:Ran GTPase-activating protein (RanGAP) involved in mRNA processing and transport
MALAVAKDADAVPAKVAAKDADTKIVAKSETVPAKVVPKWDPSKGPPRTAASKLDQFDMDTSTKVLDLKGFPVGQKDMKRVAEAISQGACTGVNLSGCELTPHLAELLAEALANKKSVVATVNLSHNEIGIKADTTNAYGKKMKDPNDKATTKLAEALLKDVSVTDLDLSYNTIGTCGAQKLARSLEKNKQLQTLTISNNPLGEPGCARIAAALKTKNRTLKTLNIESCLLGRFGGDVYGAVLMTNNALSTLNLAGNGLEDHGVVALGKALETNSTLADLSVESNEVSPWGAKLFAKSIGSNKGLKYLNLQLNTIGPEASKMLFDALETNTTLVGLLRDEV